MGKFICLPYDSGGVFSRHIFIYLFINLFIYLFIYLLLLFFDSNKTILLYAVVICVK